MVEKIIKFTQELVKIPSQNGINSEKKIAQLIFRKLKSFGFSPKIIGPQMHPSVICFLKKRNAKKTIWLESCIDTVPAGDLSKWKYPPFRGVIKENKMYGRGTADSKAGVAIFSYLAKELYNDLNFKANLFLGFDADEQSGNFTGIKQIIKIAPKTDICILGYSGNDEISIGGRGWIRLKLTTLGESAHTGGRAKKGVNAIHKMQKAISVLLKLPFLKKREKFFKYGPSLNVSIIKGGWMINIVPERCESFIDIRIIPFQNLKSIIKEIIKKLNEIKTKDKEFKFKLKALQFQPAFLSNINHPFIKILKKNGENILRKKIPLTTSGAGSVGNLISKKGIAVINGFGFGFGNVHASNEWINVGDIPKIFEIYKKSLIEFSNNDSN